MMEAAVLFLAAVATATVAGKVEQCPSYDVLEKIVYLPHPHDCSLFRRCQGGEPVLGHCPPGQHFNPATAVCGDPAQSGCKVADPDPCPLNAPQDTCPYQCSCSRKDDNSTCPARLEFSPVLEVFHRTAASCPKDHGDFDLSGEKVGRLVTANATGNASSCPANQKAGDTVNLPHFADCAKMVVCAGGSEQTHDCPSGQLYDPDMGLCDDPEFVTCSAAPRNDTPPPSAGGDCPALASCEQACSCSAVQGACPTTISFSTIVRISDIHKHPACSQEPGAISLGGGLVGSMTVAPNTTRASLCPPGATGRTYLPHPGDCGRVTLCARGVERTLSCPAGLHFNPRSRSCGPPDPAVCSAATTTTTTTTTAPPGDDDTVAYDDLPCPTTWACPAGKNSSVPHLSDCTVFCRCGSGGPFLGACPPGRHFSTRAQLCQDPATANCHSTCPQISANERGTWVPGDCTNQDSQEGAECSLACDGDYQLIGSESINCTSRGWYGSGGLNHIPSCNTPDEFAEEVDKKLNETLNMLSKDQAGIIFVLDESLSVDPGFFVTGSSENFQAQKNLASCLVKGFPLSEKRSAGVITFSSDAAVDVSLKQTSTCDFISQLRGATFFGGNTDLAAALQLAGAEINSTAPPRKTLVLIVTDGQSQADPALAAASLTAAGHVIFAIAVADFDRRQLESISSTHTDGSKLFFALPDFRLFRHLEFYLRDKYNQNATMQCP